MKRIAFYGGSFDPVHRGHLEIAKKLIDIFRLDEFVFIPAFHAPHKPERKPASGFHRFAMLCLAAEGIPKIKISPLELEAPEKPFTIETLIKLKEIFREAEIFFVMGADSWEEITTWRDWEKVLTIVNIIVVTRPGFEIGFGHVSDEIRGRIVDWRRASPGGSPAPLSFADSKTKIYLSDAVRMDVSATEIRRSIREKESVWKKSVPKKVSEHIEKYGLYA